MIRMIHRLLFPFILLIVSGCSSSLTTSVDGRLVTGTATFPYHASGAGSTPDEAAMNIAFRFFNISARQIRWPGRGPINDPSTWHSIDLPAVWKHLQLKQEPNGFEVILDGQRFTTIPRSSGLPAEPGS